MAMANTAGKMSRWRAAPTRPPPNEHMRRFSAQAAGCSFGGGAPKGRRGLRRGRRAKGLERSIACRGWGRGREAPPRRASSHRRFGWANRTDEHLRGDEREERGKLTTKYTNPKGR